MAGTLIISFYSSHHRVSPLIAPIIDKTATLPCIPVVDIRHPWMVGIPYPWIEEASVDPTHHPSRRWGFYHQMALAFHPWTATLFIHRQRRPFIR